MSEENTSYDVSEQGSKMDGVQSSDVASSMEKHIPEASDEGSAQGIEQEPEAKADIPLSGSHEMAEGANKQKDYAVPPVSSSVIHHSAIRLPNCKITGIDYHASLAEALSGFPPNEIVDVAIDQGNGNAGLDLQWNSEKYEIMCLPDKPGEFEINLHVNVVRHERHIFPFKLTVNPDPKTLWKSIPSDPNGVYAKPDSDKLFLACGENLSIVAASQRGRSHAQEGKPRDDDFFADYDVDTDCAILIVADGAGSAKFSREGSRIATRTALEKVKASTTADFWIALTPAIVKWADERNVQAEKIIQAAMYKVLVHAAWEAKTMIKQEAQNHETRYLANYKKSDNFKARDYATTLIMTIVKRFDSVRWFIATFWVGDGAMGIYRGSAGEVHVQGTPDGGEYGGQTRFLTEDSAEVWPQDANELIKRRLRFDVVDSFEAVVLMTDGVSDPKFETDNNSVSVTKWNDLWEDLTKDVHLESRDDSVADDLLKWMDFWSPGNHDDRTMIVLY